MTALQDNASEHQYTSDCETISTVISTLRDSEEIQLLPEKRQRTEQGSNVFRRCISWSDDEALEGDSLNWMAPID